MSAKYESQMARTARSNIVGWLRLSRLSHMAGFALDGDFCEPKEWERCVISDLCSALMLNWHSRRLMGGWQLG